MDRRHDGADDDARQLRGTWRVSPETGSRFRDNDMRKNRNLKRKERI